MTTPILSPIPDGFKRCTKCGEIKPLDAFQRDKRITCGRCARCKDCSSAEKRARKAQISEYNREYRLEHIDQITKRQTEYRLNNLEKVRASERERRRSEHRRATEKAYYELNRERLRKYSKEYYEKNREKIAKRNRRYRQSEHGKQMGIIKSAKRRAKIAHINNEITAKDLAAIRASQTDKRGRLICWRCNNPIKGTPHLDHWIPLDKGGAHDAGNLHYMHAKCNLEKATKLPAEIGRLL